MEKKFFLKINKIRIEKIKSKNNGKASKLTIINVARNRIIYRDNFFILFIKVINFFRI